MEELENEITDLENEIYNLYGTIEDLKCAVSDKEHEIEDLERKVEQADWTGVEPVISDISLGDAIKIKEVMVKTLKELGIRCKEINNG